MMVELLLLSLYIFALASASSSIVCTSGDSSGECINDGSDCLDASAFLQRVASFNEDESILPLLRGTVDSILSQNEIDSLLQLLPASEFVEAGGYDESNNKDGRAYNAPVAYAGLGLKELSTSHEERYNKLLEIRERVRSAAEESLGLCPGTLLIDFTTISQKTEGGAHRAHADNCLHYFDADTGAKCDPNSIHPYPNRVAASILYLNNPGKKVGGNFKDGEFYFANRYNGKVDTKVPVKAGKMIYFTSGVENLHGALPVKPRGKGSNEDPPRRLALAMWYVTDPTLEEYVPTFRETEKESPSSNGANKSKVKPKRINDPNDPSAPKELFAIPIPTGADTNALFQSMGNHLVADSNKKLWTVSKYGDDTLHVLFMDHSAMFSLDFGVAVDDSAGGAEYAEASVVFERHTDGRKPASLQYMLQESVMLHGVLDALSKLILEGISIENDEIQQRYFEGEVDKARSTLPARRG